MSAAVAAAAAAAISSRRTRTTSTTTTTTASTNGSNSYTPLLRQQQQLRRPSVSSLAVISMSRYETQKRRDWITFMDYLNNHRYLDLSKFDGSDVVEFIKYLGEFGETKLQGWGSVDGMIGRLRVAFVENGGKPGNNPFGSRVVSLYLSELKDAQDKARGRR